MRTRPLTARQIVALWDWGKDRHPVDRSLAMLRYGVPDSDADALADLTIGQRDGLLLDLRAQTIGPTLELTVRCPRCHEHLEFPVEIQQIRLPVPDRPGGSTYEVEHQGWRARFRLATSRDEAGIAATPDPARARADLLRACLLEVVAADGGAVDLGSDEAPGGAPQQGALAELYDRVLEAMSEHDPQADLRFGCTCPECAAVWSAQLDIGQFFWAELEGRVASLVAEVHTLARYYHWSEADILEMSPQRRARYVELARDG